jgi:hypothetical protein
MREKSVHGTKSKRGFPRRRRRPDNKPAGPGPLADHLRVLKDPLAKAERDAIIASKGQQAATGSKQTRKAQPASNRSLAGTKPVSHRSKTTRRRGKEAASRKTAQPPEEQRSRRRVIDTQRRVFRNVNDIPSSDPPKILLGKTPVGYVPWKMLPPGEPVFAWLRSLNLNGRRYETGGGFDIGRLEALMGYNPAQCYIGIDNFDGSIVFLFTHTKKIALECPTFGNAIYVVEGDWRTLCRLSKSELLNARPKHVVIRIVHRGKWRTRLRAALK